MHHEIICLASACCAHPKHTALLSSDIIHICYAGELLSQHQASSTAAHAHVRHEMPSSLGSYGIASNSRKLLTDSAFQALQDYVNQKLIPGLHHCTAVPLMHFNKTCCMQLPGMTSCHILTRSSACYATFRWSRRLQRHR